MVDLIDPTNAAEIFADGVHEVKIAGAMTRIVLFTSQNGTRLVAARLRLPVAVLPDVIQALVIALAEAAKTPSRPKRR